MNDTRRTFRAAGAADVNELASLSLRAYPVPDRSEDSVRERYTENPWSTLEDVIVGEEGGRAVATAFLHPFRVFAWQRSWGAGGLGGVAVAPDRRRSGWARDLVLHTQRLCRERDWPLMPLYPFRVDFYASLGWGIAETREVHTFPVVSIPDDPAAGAVRVVTIADAPSLLGVYERFAMDRNGHVARTPEGWTAILLRRLPFIAVHDGENGTNGYMLYRVESAGRHPLHQRLRVLELVWTTDEAWRGLWGFVRRQADQIAEVAYESREEDAIHHHAAHPSLAGGPILGGAFHEISRRGVGTMMKLIDPVATLSARRYGPGAGLVNVTVHDPLTSESERFALEVEGGRGGVRPHGVASDTLALGSGTWAAIECGAITLAHAIRLGKAELDGDPEQWSAMLAAPRWQIFEGF